MSLTGAAKIKLLMNTYPRQKAKYIRNVFEKRKTFLNVNNLLLSAFKAYNV